MAAVNEIAALLVGPSSSPRINLVPGRSLQLSSFLTLLAVSIFTSQFLNIQSDDNDADWTICCKDSTRIIQYSLVASSHIGSHPARPKLEAHNYPRYSFSKQRRPVITIAKMDQAAELPRKCPGLECENDASTLQCPKCKEMSVDTFFCSQDCFKRSWVSRPLGDFSQDNKTRSK